MMNKLSGKMILFSTSCLAWAVGLLVVAPAAKANTIHAGTISAGTAAWICDCTLPTGSCGCTC